MENIKENIPEILIIIALIKIAIDIGLIITVFNISNRETKQDKGQDIIIDKIETLEYQCANINNNLKAILEELQDLNDKTPYPENEEEKYNINNQQYRPNSGINDFKLYDNNR